MATRSRRSGSVFGASALLLATACGGGSSGATGPVCPNTDTTVVELRDLSPALGASVPGASVDHTFTTVGVDAYFAEFRLVTLPAHTAGALPAGTLFTKAAIPREGGSGLDYTYSMTIVWPTTPGHVAVADDAFYVNPKDGCRVALPNPLFEYDIAP